MISSFLTGQSSKLAKKADSICAQSVWFSQQGLELIPFLQPFLVIPWHAFAPAFFLLQHDLAGSSTDDQLMPCPLQT